ncbi:hypothetical protein GCK32_005772 [Trichostrongylus colubriformis]|uniref:Uncharacterized protein n=1 Tax=Trichostrongylus colubriformis TaxID=6319 RepID=A0AAN8FP36_TRICO
MEEDDPTLELAATSAVLKTRRKTKQALRSLISLTRRFWKISKFQKWCDRASQIQSFREFVANRAYTRHLKEATEDERNEELLNQRQEHSGHKQLYNLRPHERIIRNPALEMDSKIDSKVGSLLFQLQLYKSELGTVKKEQENSKKSLPSFPSPRVLYDKIVDTARDVMLYSNSLDDIRNNVLSLTNFLGKWIELEKDVQLLEAKTENCEI